jgi:hypothetical protein
MELHGSIAINWKKDTLHLKLDGPFNAEGANYFSYEIKKYIRNRPVERWKRLVELSADSIGCPEVMSVAKHMNSWYIENGCIGSAIITDCPIQKDTYKNHGSRHKIFKDRELAIEWLKEL